MRSRKIMVVDDDDILQFTTKMMLKLDGYLNVVGYTSPVAALKFLQDNQEDKNQMPDLILLDINMPIMDGFEFLNFVDETIKHNIPTVFMVSSSISPKDIERSMAHNIVKEYISKPVNPALLYEKMKQHLG